MPRLLIVHHSPTPSVAALTGAVKHVDSVLLEVGRPYELGGTLAALVLG
ncbi:hypothetical protein [Nocardioides sp. SYSU D00065]|nr:hypothetical protein [Nocardioides sp. SYSU D00065]